MKILTWQNPGQLFVAQELINKVKLKCCGIKVRYNRASCYFWEITIDIETAPESHIIWFLFIYISIIFYRLRERYSKIGIICPSPAIRYPITSKQGIIFNSQMAPKHFTIVIINTMTLVSTKKS